MNFQCSSLDTLTNSLALSVYFERIFTNPTSYSQTYFIWQNTFTKKTEKRKEKLYVIKLLSCKLNYY